MTLSEDIVILIGLVAGYWLVSKLLFRRPTAPPNSQTSGGPPGMGDTAGCYEVLQVPPTASTAELRAAYKTLISKYHPDKLDNLGEELKALAERKTQEITRAYREAMAARGETP